MTQRPTAGPSDPAAVEAGLTQAIAIAEANVAAGGGPFGAVVLGPDGSIVATGVNRVTADLDPTAHAEVCAIRGACRSLQTFDLSGCTLVCSCEPCPLCLAAALWARIDQIHYAADRMDAAAAGFDDAAFYDLLERERSTWPSPPVRHEVDGSTRPFDAWRAQPDRIDY